MKACADAILLESLLTGELDAAEQSQLEQHLVECGVCCQRLETLARGDLVVPGPDELAGRGVPSGHLQSALRQLLAPGDSVSRPGSTFWAGDTLASLSFLSPAADLSHSLDPARQGDLVERRSAEAAGSFSTQASIGFIAGYQIISVLGRGNMGVVLKAHDLSLRRTVAIKVLNPSLAITPRACERFLREARSAAAVQSDHVVTIHAVDTHNQLPYLVMEFVDGPSLQEHIDSGRMGFEEVRRVGIEAARGLAAAHALGLVHRDVKPANILLARDSRRVKISDFGLAKSIDDTTLTGPGVIAGTPEYMSPEQASGTKVDTRSDLFSLGLVLYAACTGRPPLQGNSVPDTLRRICHETPKPLRQAAPELPDWFCKLVDGLLKKKPERRPASARAVEEALSHQTAGRRASPTSSMAARLAVVMTVTVLIAAGAWLVRARLVTPEVPPAASPMPQTGFRIAGRERVLPDLHQAIDVAENGDVIEVFGNGPFLSDPVTIDGKALTIRAAGLGHPLFLPDPPRQTSDGPWLVSNTDLSLEGIDVQWSLPGSMPGEHASNLLSSCVVVANRGHLRLLNCRISAGQFNGCLGISCEEAELTSSHLISESGFCLFWNPEEAARMSITGSVLEGRASLIVWPQNGNWNDKAPQLTLRDNTMSARTMLRIMIDREPHSPVQAVAEHNIFDVSHLCDMMAIRNLPRAAFPPAPERVLRLLNAQIHWSESGNVYATGVEFLTCSMSRRPMISVPSGPKTLTDWLVCWSLSEDVSTLADDSQAGGDLRSAGIPAGTGADEGQVGPGAAYHNQRVTH